VATQRRIPPALLGAAYLGLTVAGLYLFRGIPVLNVALGFPIGAWIAARLEERPADVSASTQGSIPPGTLRALLGWAVGITAVTVAAGWVEILLAVSAQNYPGSLGSIVRWLPIRVHEPPTSLRAILFAIAAAPALQVLTTVFGGFLALVVSRGQIRKG